MTKILVDKAAIEQALEALSNTGTQRGREPQQFHAEGVSIEALRAALDQPQVEQEPVAWRCFDGEGDFEYRTDEPSNETRSWSARYNREWFPLYTHSQNLNCKSNQHRLATLWGYEKPQPPRQPLTHQQRQAMWYEAKLLARSTTLPFEWYCMGISDAEAIHGIGESNA